MCWFSWIRKKIESLNVGASVNTLLDVLRWRAEYEAHQCAYVFLSDQGEEKITYSELNHKAQIIARLLLEENAKGDRVMLFFNPGLNYIVAFFGCLYAGMIAVPAYPPKNNRHMHSMILLPFVGDPEEKQKVAGSQTQFS